jgi:hypothetical protein
LETGQEAGGKTPLEISTKVVLETGVTWKNPQIFVSTVAGISLIAKVWIIRHLLGLEVDVLELVIPLGLLLPHEMLVAMARARERRARISPFWLSNLTWTVIIVLATGLSLVPYLR